MKIALCYSGRPKSFEETFNNHKRALIDFNDAEADIFAHFWEPAPKLKRRILDDVPHKKIVFEKLKDEEFKKEAEINIHQPELKLGYGWFDAVATRDAAAPHAALSMFYSTKKSINLALDHERAHSFKYDFIFRIRSDLFFVHNTLDKLERHDNSKLNISPRTCAIQTGRPDGSAVLIDDRFAFGSGEIMEKYCSIYPDYKEITREHLVRGLEHLLGMHVQNNKLSVHANEWQIVFTKGLHWREDEKGCGVRGGFRNKQK